MRAKISALNDYRKHLIAVENKCAGSTKPSAIQAVKDLLKSKRPAAPEKARSGRPGRAGCPAHHHGPRGHGAERSAYVTSSKWGMLLRAELLLQVALAGRNSDCRQPLYKHLALRRFASLLVRSAGRGKRRHRPAPRRGTHFELRGLKVSQWRRHREPLGRAVPAPRLLPRGCH